MGLIDTYNRWKQIVLNTKLNRKRVLNLEKNLQNNLAREYPSLENESISFKSKIQKQEAKIFSQNGEDGILMYLLSIVGVESYSMLEIGIGDGSECNSRNFIENFGWNAWLIDGNKVNLEKAAHYYKQIKSTKVTTHHSWVTKDNIGKTIENLDVPIHLDVLSIDIDGNDYWVWKAIKTIDPRIVIIEYNASFGKTKSVTVPYEKNFNRYKKHKSGYYHGASLLALKKLGEEKSYSFVCCDSSGVNAFFLKKSLAENVGIKNQEVANVFTPQEKRCLIMSLDEQLNLINHLELIEI